MKLKNIPLAVVNACRNRDRSDEEIERMTPRELLSEWLQWEGIIGYDHAIWDVVTKLSRGGRR